MGEEDAERTRPMVSAATMDARVSAWYSWLPCEAEECLLLWIWADAEKSCSSAYTRTTPARTAVQQMKKKAGCD